MAVLVEANSVIVRRETIDARFEGGFEAFRRLAPAETLCTDGEIVRVGFDALDGLVAFLRLLQARGLRYGVGPAEDEVATFQLEIGPNGHRSQHSPCDWVGYANYLWTETGWRVITAILKGGQAPKDEVVFPPGWDYERSPSWGMRVKGLES